VLRQVGDYLGRLAGRDLTGRCRLGWGPDRRADRKRALTADSSSRWAGAITRTSNDQWERAYANLRDTRVGLRRGIKKTRARADRSGSSVGVPRRPPAGQAPRGRR
jgi:hypothetical protein